ncbi:MAG: dNA repair protein radA [Candidatus Daviesbacteria bacterium GW2011_GWC1_40_9]|nr:MAG: dNA repair protein radA [Candidatus Daviesbacteria bacterium GW2011_GWC1_40_9]
MAKSSSVYICQQCGFRSSQYLGRCPECGSWNSLVEEVQTEAPNFKKNSRVLKLPEIINLVNIERQKYERLTSGLGEFDRVLGGGIVLGSVVLASGDPGIGKSTLLTQLALNLNLSNKSNLSNVLYVAGEESAQQIKIRVDRIQLGANLSVLNEVDVDAICAVIEQQRPSLVIVDSIQTLKLYISPSLLWVM